MEVPVLYHGSCGYCCMDWELQLHEPEHEPGHNHVTMSRIQLKFAVPKFMGEGSMQGFSDTGTVHDPKCVHCHLTHTVQWRISDTGGSCELPAKQKNDRL